MVLFFVPTFFINTKKINSVSNSTVPKIEKIAPDIKSMLFKLKLNYKDNFVAIN